jgi:large repetitive protein
MHARRRTPFALLALLIALTTAGAVDARGVAVPRPAAPAAGAAHPELPPFVWRATRGAAGYEFQIAADRGFNSRIPGIRRTRIDTENTRVTVTTAVPNGTYWWRVRAVTKAGQVSAWSSPRSVRKSWTAAPSLRSPVNGARVAFPAQPLTLSWSPVPRAAKYLISLATDQDLATLVGDEAIETSGTSFAPSLTPAGGKGRTYYWAVTPVDANGNRGAQSRTASFTWEWPSQTSGRLTDLRGEPETFDPQFAWQPVAGAARYEVEVSHSSDFAPGSKVCCDGAVIGTSLTPTKPLPDNTYYWRVRPVDVDGNVGVWSPGEAVASRFEKVFDKAAALGRPSIANLRMRDDRNDPAPPGPTQTPIVTWDPVPGASSYFVEVVPYAGTFCDWSAPRIDHWRSSTATTAWTPLGYRLTAPAPYPDKFRVQSDAARLVAGTSYCVRVRAKSDTDARNAEVYGDFAHLGGPDRPAFTFAGYPCQTGCARGYLSASDYLTGQGSTAVTPFFTWGGPNAASWFVLVAKDPEFHTIVDYGWTQVRAYAPRAGDSPLTYPDETTEYYWAVLPASGFNGAGAVGDPLSASPARFTKQSTPPRLVAPGAGASASGPPVFTWTPVQGARRYNLQVSREDDFGKLLDNVTTSSISYTANAIYPADVALYWRVRAEDEKGIGLTWSERRVLRFKLPAPDVAGGPTSGDFIPTWRWQPVQGAVTYEMHVQQPDGRQKTFDGIRASALTAVKMTGTGVFRWRVRASFPQGRSGTVSGPWSRTRAFTRTLGRPTGARTVGGGKSVHFRWNPKTGAHRYVVQVSERPDFARVVDRVTTDQTTYAPELRLRGERKTLFWRVAAVDEDRNESAWTKPKRFRAG